jgi:raffinose/stachyose/melibiose transport system permease protein
MLTMRVKFRQWWSKYWLLLPALCIYLIFLIYPMGDSLWVSFKKWDGVSAEKTFIGLQNYITFFKDPISRLVLKNNLLWTVFTLIFPMSLGLLLAMVLDKQLPAKNLFRSIFYLPAILPMISVGLIWAWIYNPFFGALNVFLKWIGLGKLAHGWLADSATALPAVMVTAIWRNVGMPMILFLAGLQSIPRELYEAAQIDGANRLQSFRYITLPSLRETFVIVMSLLIVSSLTVFDLIYVMTWGGPGRQTQVLATWMYFNTFIYHNAGYGSAIAWIMTFATILITFPYIRIMSRK